MFQGFNEVVAYYFLEGATPQSKLIINMVHACVWYMLLQVLLAYISGAVSSEELCPHKDQEEDDESEDVGSDMAFDADSFDGASADAGSQAANSQTQEELKIQTIKYNMKTWGVLMGHVTGFACINAFGTLQIFVVGEHPLRTRDTVMRTLIGGPLAAAIAL